MENVPNYRRLYETGELDKRIQQLGNILSNCTLCPRNCGIDRRNGQKGHCHADILPTISSVSPHFGEEPPLVGYYGSGTIFMTGCSLHCIYCQNYDISQLHHGQSISFRQLADNMLNLQEKGCHNINFVTPTHQVFAILQALKIAIKNGLSIPLVYNSGGYDSIDSLQIIEGVFDIYMPDFKYWNAQTGMRLSGIPDYPAVAKLAIREMYRQAGNLQVNEAGIAYRGLIVRHLVLPGLYNESKRVIDFVTSLSGGIYLNLMNQYRPEYKACDEKELNGFVNREEFIKLAAYASRKGAWLAKF